MKFQFALLLVVVALMAVVQAQENDPNCRASLENKNCDGDAQSDENSGPLAPVNMWFYDGTSRACKRFIYRGSGNSNNRYCNRRECQQCARQG